MNLELPERYQLGPNPVLGEGGMGRVLLARDVVLDMPVALKVVRPTLASDPTFSRLFDIEVRMSARFTHPNIVPLHDRGVTSLGTPWLGLAYADAGSFAQYRDDPVAWPVLAKLTLQLLDALAHLHARGVLHLDLKPENVLLHTTAPGERGVWLADLGLANAEADLARAKGRREGTPGFMAPEQWLGLPREYGPWTDLYALGVMLWEITTGSKPFLEHQTALDAPIPDFRPRMSVPESLGKVLANLLDPEPLARYDLAADLKTEILALGTSPDEWGETQAQGRSSGTVAPSAYHHSGSVDLTANEWPRDTSARSVEADSAARSTLSDPNVPAWNRPFPAAMPDAPPPQVTSTPRSRASLPLFALREPPLVGRDEARRVLWGHAVAVARECTPRVVVVVGERGAGKGRLVESILLALEEGGWAESLRLSWQEQENADDGYPGAARALLRPWNESRTSLVGRLKRRLAREHGRFDAAVVKEAETLARWCGLLLEEEEPVAGGIGLREVYRHLDARTWRGLACLAMHNVAWSRDEGDGLAIAEALFASEFEGIGDKPLLVIATVRPEELQADEELAARVNALEQAGAYRMDLPRLDRRQTLEMLEESLRLAPQLALRVVNRCEGNPLFAHQLLLEWVDRGWLVDTGGLTFDLAPGVDAAEVLPGDVEELFYDRVDRLALRSGAERRFRDVVHMAALAGRTLPRELVLALAGDSLRDFVRGCGLFEAREQWLGFDSSMLHQAMLTQAECRPDVEYLHRRLGRAWARHGEEAGADVAMAAGRHAALGRDWELAVEQLLLAAKRAWRRGQSHDLDETSKLGFELVRQHEDLWRYWGRAALLRGRSLQMQGVWQQAEQAYAEAIDRIRSGDEGTSEVEALCGQGWCRLRSGAIAGAESAYTQAVSRARALSDPRGEALAIAGKAWVEQQKRNFDGAAILFTRAVTRLGRLDDALAFAQAMLGQAFVARRTGEFEEAIELYEEAAEAFREGEDPIGEARADLGRAIAMRQRGSYEQAAALLRDALVRAEGLGAMDLLSQIRMGLADLHRLRGDTDRARRIYEDQVDSPAYHAFEDRILARLGLALLALDHGDLDEVYQQTSATVGLLERVPGHWLWATYRLVVATMLAERGDAARTWEWLWSADELGLRDTVDVDGLQCLERIFSLARERGTGWERTRQLAEKLLVSQVRRLGKPGPPLA